MTPEALAQLHALAFTTPRPFTATEFAALLDTPSVFLCTVPLGFVLGRVIAGEAELLTLAVDPAKRRQGAGRRLVLTYEARIKAMGAAQSFLEVDETNSAAIGLYRALGYTQTGRRKGYYRHPDGQRTDALVFCHRL